jgi:hypothetical protein
MFPGKERVSDKGRWHNSDQASFSFPLSNKAKKGRACMRLASARAAQPGERSDRANHQLIQIFLCLFLIIEMAQ